MLNKKYHQIVDLSNELASAHGELENLGPLLDVARDIYSEYKTRVDNNDNIEGDYEAAIAVVRTRYGEQATREVVSGIAATVRDEQVALMKHEVEEEKGPEFAEQERVRFLKEDAPTYREHAEREVAQQISRLTSEQLQAGIKDGVFAKKLLEAQERERVRFLYEQRIVKIAEQASTTLRVPLAEIGVHEPFNITLTYKQVSNNNTSYSNQAQQSRHIHFSMLKPDEGKAVVLDDDWQKGGQLEVLHCLNDGQVVILGNVLDDGGTETIDHAITLGLPLEIRHGDRTLSLPEQEVTGMVLGTDQNGLQLLPPGSRVTQDIQRLIESWKKRTTSSMIGDDYSRDINYDTFSVDLDR